MARPASLPPAPSATAVPPGRLSVIVTFMEMTAPPAHDPVPVPRDGLLLMRARSPTVSFYRYLYDTVGEPWLWNERRQLTDAELARLVQDPRVEVHVLYADGTPAGYAELNRTDPTRTDLGYFGLIPDFIGQRLGPWLLDRAIRLGWEGGARRLTVNTCTFDHPKALPLYRSMGFRPCRHVSRIVDDPRVTGWLPRTATPHVPIVE